MTSPVPLPWDHPEADPAADVRTWIEAMPLLPPVVIVTCPPRVWELVKDEAPRWEAELTEHFGRLVKLVERDPLPIPVSVWSCCHVPTSTGHHAEGCDGRQRDRDELEEIVD